MIDVLYALLYGLLAIVVILAISVLFDIAVLSDLKGKDFIFAVFSVVIIVTCAVLASIV